MVVKSQYNCSMRVDTNCYWNQQPRQNVITVPTRTIIHPQPEVNTVTDFYTILTSVYAWTQAKKSIPRQPIRLTDYDYDYIL